ncbi:molybdopterin-containing oxidoreductase family protein [Desulfovibrio inopinatus]|uniref:molybdopterin-containing oxidoreductase family protein n=1 Tax=Desulfovibrio inopinatus TaxID=102109 RepID=UPI0004078DFC|nr:molybdopterin-dependent oxidoreductase [Desulfovibrio inopinatus]
MTTKVVTTCTRDCPGCCGLSATVDAGRLTGLGVNPDFPLGRGGVCAKARAYVDRVYDPERVVTPLRRTRAGFERVGWSDALDEMADKLLATREKHGPEAVLYYMGYGERTALKLLNARFFNLFGGVTTLSGSLCGGTGQASQNLDFGERISHDPLDHLNAQSVILWGRNPVVTQHSLLWVLRDLKKQGKTLLVVDPTPSATARVFGGHIAVRPGGDVWLAMAAAGRVMERGLVNDRFISEYGEGFKEFSSLVKRYTVDDMAYRAGVLLDDVDRLASAMTNGAPAAILLGWGLHRRKTAHQSIRAIDALSAMTGNIGIAGGGVSQGFEEYGPYDPAIWGEDLAEPRRKLSMPSIGRSILEAKDPGIEMIVVSAANPVCMAPQAKLTRRAFEKTPFVVSMAQFLDDTSELADLVLPCATFLEERDVVAGYGHNYVGPVNKAIEPVGECRSQFDIFMDLASRFEFGSELIDTEERWLTRILRPLFDKGVTLADIEAGPIRIPDAPFVPYADKIFPTPSGKFRFMTEFVEEVPNETESYPYRLLSVGGAKFLCSERTMASHVGLPEISMAYEEVQRLGVSDGDAVEVCSPYGRLQAQCKSVKGQRRDVVIIPRGGWIKAGHGVNLLTRDGASDVGEGTPYYDCTVSVKPMGD